MIENVILLWLQGIFKIVRSLLYSIFILVIYVVIKLNNDHFARLENPLYIYASDKAATPGRVLPENKMN